MYEENTTMQSNPAAAKLTAVLPAVLAMMFGIFLITGTGFAQSASLHNAAHDIRHANAFPCH